MLSILIFGTGLASKLIEHDLDFSKVKILCWIDNNTNKVDNQKIFSADIINNLQYDYIVIASSYYDEITEQLINLGIANEKIIPYFKNNCKYTYKKQLLDIIKYEAFISKQLEDIEKQFEKNQKTDDNIILLSKLHINNIIKMKNVSRLEEVEFKIFSQWGQDGIIQYLINNMDIPNKIFIEFGANNYTESNTRFLLINNNWSGFVMDGSKENIEYIKNDDIYYKYDLIAEQAFITVENINDLIRKNIRHKDIGLLSIDIDGNDYWVWEKINEILPRIVICEYNSILGYEKKVVIPYDSAFNRTKAHYSNLYFGASINALYDLANKKGYDFIGCNSAGNDAFFVRKDLSKNFKMLSQREGYVESKARESRDKNGKLNYISGKNRLKEIKNMTIFNLDSNENILIKDLYEI